MAFPKYLEVELKYQYMDEPVVYKFPRLRKKDAQLEEKEKITGRKLTMADRLAELLEDAHGLDGLEPRSAKEPEAEWRARVARYFGTEDNQELAEDALVYRLNAVYPRATFRSGEAGRVAVDIRGQEGAAGA